MPQGAKLARAFEAMADGVVVADTRTGEVLVNAAARRFLGLGEGAITTRFLAEKLGFTGTPSWVVGGKVIEGAIGYEGLDAAIDDARES